MSLRPCSCLLLLATALSLVASPTARSQGKPPDQLRTLSRQELDVVKILTGQERAWNTGNIEAYVGAYKNSPETLFMTGSVTRGFDELLQEYKRNYITRDSMGTLVFSDLEPRVLDDRFAIVLGHYHLDRSKKLGGSADGVFSTVLEKTADGWKIVLSHTN
jgi:ketosteroid isomerase-like protein